MKTKGFTLVELLIVIGIIATLSVAAVLIINPVEYLARTQDSRRLSELNDINRALQIGAARGITDFGEANKVYISLPDDTSPTCNNLGLPSLPSGWEYRCSSSADYRKVGSSGWIPVDFASLADGSPLSVLPIDPINTAADNFYYSYVIGGSWELTAWLESARYFSQGSRDNGDSIAYEVGTNLTLTPNRKTSFQFNDFPIVVTKAGQPGWYKNAGSGTVSLGSDGEGNYLNANQYVWYEWQENIPFNPNALYKISCRVRQVQDPTSGGKSIYCGVAGVASNKTTYINASGANSYGSQHYFAASGDSLAADAGYTTFTGYFKGHGTPAGGKKSNPSAPGKMYPGVAYIRPLFILNYSGGNGIADIDFEILEVVE